VGFEPTIPASERLQTHALDRAATGIGIIYNSSNNNNKFIGGLFKDAVSIAEVLVKSEVIFHHLLRAADRKYLQRVLNENE
jgi:hypothetical protein